MYDNWLSTSEAADHLEKPSEHRAIYGIIKLGLLPSSIQQITNKRWLIKPAEIQHLKGCKNRMLELPSPDLVTDPDTPTSPQSPLIQPIEESDTPPETEDIDPGMVEASMALAAIAGAMAALLPGATGIDENFRDLVAAITGVMAVLSAYSALWFLSQYCLKEESSTGLIEVPKLLFFPLLHYLFPNIYQQLRFTPVSTIPYCLVAWGLFLWLGLSVVLGAIAVS